MRSSGMCRHARLWRLNVGAGSGGSAWLRTPPNSSPDHIRDGELLRRSAAASFDGSEKRRWHQSPPPVDFNNMPKGTKTAHSGNGPLQGGSPQPGPSNADGKSGWLKKGRLSMSERVTWHATMPRQRRATTDWPSPPMALNARKQK